MNLDIPIENIPGVLLHSFHSRSDERGNFAKPLIFAPNEISEELSICYTQNKRKGTVRGLHLQLMPKGETKHVTCIRGAIFDVVLDLRRDSTTFLSFAYTKLDEKSPVTLVIPPGVAHGYQTLQDETLVLYGIQGRYSEKESVTINPFDSQLRLNWPLALTNVSEQDKSAPPLSFYIG